MNKDT